MMTSYRQETPLSPCLVLPDFFTGAAFYRVLEDQSVYNFTCWQVFVRGIVQIITFLYPPLAMLADLRLHRQYL
jgi:heme/copper-type cytochrome/quinol oxidase subunit 4